MIKKLLSRLFSRQGREEIIEDPRFRNNEIGTKLVGLYEPRTDLPHMIHDSYKDKQEEERRFAKERYDMNMANRNRKYVSKTTIPAEEVERPSNSELKEHQE